MDLASIKEETEDAVEEFLEAKKELDVYLSTLKEEKEEHLNEWKNFHGKSTPILPNVAETFVRASCKLKPYLLFWEFLRFRYMGESILTYDPGFIIDSIQLHALINRYLLSLHYYYRNGIGGDPTSAGRLFITQSISQVLGEVGVLDPAIRNLRTTMRTEFPIQKSEEVILLVGGDTLSKERGPINQLLDGEGDNHAIQIGEEGDEKDVQVVYVGTERGKRLKNAYYISEIPSVIYNGFSVPAVNKNVAKVLSEDGQTPILGETEGLFEELEEIRFLEAIGKSIKMRKRRAGKPMQEEWLIDNEGEEWLEASSGLVEVGEKVSPDYYLLKAAEKVREIVPNIQRKLSQKYSNFFRTRPEMAASLPVLMEASLDIIGGISGEDRLEIEPRDFFAKPFMWMNFMLMIAASYECRGYKYLLEMNVSDIQKPKDRVIFLGDKNCDTCPVFYSRKTIKKWIKRGKHKGVYGELYHNGRSLAGARWCRRLYLVTSPEQAKWFKGVKRKKQRIKTRETPLLLWSTRVYGNDSDEGFGEETPITEILTKLFKNKKDEVLQRKGPRVFKGPPQYVQRQLPPQPREPAERRGRAPSTTPSQKRGEPVPPPPEEGEDPKRYAYRLSEMGIPQITRRSGAVDIQELLKKYYDMERSQSTISRWIREIRDYQV